MWALKDYGFRVVLAPKFADIFRGNSGKQGLVTGIISQEDCESLWKLLEAEPGTEVTVSLEDKTWCAGAISGHLPDRRLRALDAHGRVGRHRPHPAPREGDRDLRGRASLLQAAHAAGEILTKARGFVRPRLNALRTLAPT